MQMTCDAAHVMHDALRTWNKDLPSQAGDIVVVRLSVAIAICAIRW